MWTLCRCGTENVEPNIRRMSLRMDDVSHFLRSDDIMLIGMMVTRFTMMSPEVYSPDVIIISTIETCVSED